MATETKKFDLNFLYVQLTTCYEKTIQMDMDSYILAYTEINKFFGILGTVFGFVASDVTSKLETLKNFRNGIDGQQFESIECMILFEKNKNLFKNSKYVSASRTLLRLHRALQFIFFFLDELCQLEMNDNLTKACQNSYNSTLACYHPWIVQKAAIMAMYALPDKEELLKRIKLPHETEEYYTELLSKTVVAMKEVFLQTQKLYEDHNLLDLP